MENGYLETMYIMRMSRGKRLASFVDPIRDLFFNYRGYIWCCEGATDEQGHWLSHEWYKRPQGFIDRARTFWISSIKTAVTGFRLGFKEDLK